MSIVAHIESSVFPKFPTKCSREKWFRSELGKPGFAGAALLAIFQYQTEQEKSANATSEHNGVGFSGVDAEILSSFAKQFIAKGKLSDKQVSLLLKKMPKYAVQLIGHLEGKGLLAIDKNAELPAETPGLFAAVAAAAVPVFANADVEAASAPKAGEPDWRLYRKLLGLSNKVGVDADAEADYKELVSEFIGECDDFAQAVWQTVSGNLPGVPSFKQAKIIAIACAKVSGKLVTA